MVFFGFKNFSVKNNIWLSIIHRNVTIFSAICMSLVKPLLHSIIFFFHCFFSIFRSLCIIVRPHLPHFILAKSTFKRHLLTADVKHSASGWRNSHSACHTFLPDSSRKFCIKSDSRTLVQIGAKRYTNVWKGKNILLLFVK